MVFMTFKKTLKVMQLLLVTFSLTTSVYAGDGGLNPPTYDYDTGGGDNGGGYDDGGYDGGDGGRDDRDDRDIDLTDHTRTEIRYVQLSCDNTCDSGYGSHRHYSDRGGCGHRPYSDGDRYSGDNGRGGSWRDRVECSSRYSACSQILCESNYAEFRACERMEEDYERNGRGRRGGSGDGDCYECSINNESTYAENVSAWMNPLAYIATGLGSAYLGYKGQRAWADAYASGNEQCTSRFNSALDYNITRGSNPYLADEMTDMLGACNGSGMGGYAGFGGMVGNGFGGFGNPYQSAGYSGGFLGGMVGPYGGQFPGGMYPGMGGGLGGGLQGGFHIGIGGGFGGGYGGGLGQGGGYHGGGYFPGGGLTGGGGIYAGGAGLGQPGGFYNGGNGGFYPGSWNGNGNGGYWGNSGGFQNNQFWQQQQQQQSVNNYANQVNQANYMTGQVAGNALASNYVQSRNSMYQGMQGPSGFYGGTPYQQGPGFNGGFSYGVNYGFGASGGW